MIIQCVESNGTSRVGVERTSKENLKKKENKENPSIFKLITFKRICIRAFFACIFSSSLIFSVLKDEILHLCFWLCANVSLLFNKFYSQHVNICDKDHPPAGVQDALLSNIFFLVGFGFVLLFSLGVLLVACCLTVQMHRDVPPGPLSANNVLCKEFRFQRAHAEDHDISQLTWNLMFRNRIPLACGNKNLGYFHSRFPLL